MAHRRATEFIYAFPKAVLVMVGYLFLGAVYEILMKVNGFNLDWMLTTSLIVFAGSLQYLGVTLLAGMVNPIYMFLIGLMINARYLFYGISMLDKFRDIRGWKKLYLVSALTDRTFSVLCDEEVPERLGKGRVYLWVSVLDHAYWTIGSLPGAAIGGVITFNTAEFSFVLAALFVVIFVDQWKPQKDHRPVMIGLLASILCPVIWGASAFIIPATILILAVLTFNYKKGERA